MTLASMHSAMPRYVPVLLAIAFQASMAGCKGPEPVMTVGLQFGEGGLACSEAGVTLVDYVLFGAEGVVRRAEGVPCADLLFSFIADDGYELEARGFDEGGVERFVGRCGDLPFAGEDVVHSCNIATAVAPLWVEVRWDTTQSAEFIPGTCWTAGVVRYNVVLRDAEAEAVDARPGVLCDGPDTVLLDFGSLPLGLYELEVVGYSDDDVPNWEGSCTVEAGATGMIVCDARDD